MLGLTTLLAASITAAFSFLPESQAQGQGDQTRRLTVVQVRAGDQTGSGVLIKQLDQGYVVVTNNHVIRNKGTICVKTNSGEMYRAFRIGKENPDLDLAFLWLAKSNKQEVTANLGTRFSQRFAIPLSTIVATGYPDNQPYSEREGLVVPLLPYPLEDGYNLTYTATVDKGMSGGGVFSSQGVLLGINGIHSQPLWSAEIRDYKGRVVPAIIAKRIENVAIGLSLESVLKEWNTIQPDQVPTTWRKPDQRNACLSRPK